MRATNLSQNCKYDHNFFGHATEWLWVAGTSCHRGTVLRWNQWLKVGASMSIVPPNKRWFGRFRRIQKTKKHVQKKRRSGVFCVDCYKSKDSQKVGALTWNDEFGAMREAHVKFFAMLLRFSRWWQRHQNPADCGVIYGGCARHAPYQLDWSWLTILILHNDCRSKLSWRWEIVGPPIIST